MSDTIKVKRTFQPVGEDGEKIGDAVAYEGEFSYTFPTEQGEDYTAQFESEKAMWQHHLRSLKNRIKQAAGSFLLQNEGNAGLQEFMDEYQIGERSAGGRKKELAVTPDQLAAAGISTENMATLAQILGIKVNMSAAVDNAMADADDAEDASDADSEDEAA